MVKEFGGNPGYMPGMYQQGRFSRLGRGEMRLFEMLGLGDHVYEDSKGRHYGEKFLATLLGSTPFVGLQLAGILDKRERAIGFTQADPNWDFRHGFGYFLLGWSGVAKPYEFDPLKNLDQKLKAFELLMREETERERRERAAEQMRLEGF